MSSSLFSFWLAFYDVGFILATVRLLFFLLILSSFWWMRLSVLCNLPASKNWWWEKLDLVQVGRIMLWWLGLCCLPVSCLAWCNPVLGCKGSMVKLTVTSKRTYTKGHFLDCCCHYFHPFSKTLLTHTSTWDPQTLAGWSGAVFCGVTATLHCVLVCVQDFVYILHEWRLCFLSSLEIL